MIVWEIIFPPKEKKWKVFSILNWGSTVDPLISLKVCFNSRVTRPVFFTKKYRNWFSEYFIGAFDFLFVLWLLNYVILVLKWQN